MIEAFSIDISNVRENYYHTQRRDVDNYELRNTSNIPHANELDSGGEYTKRTSSLPYNVEIGVENEYFASETSMNTVATLQSSSEEVKTLSRVPLENSHEFLTLPRGQELLNGSGTSELPTYKSLTEFFLTDCPPSYETVTGTKSRYDEVGDTSATKSEPTVQVIESRRLTTKQKGCVMCVLFTLILLCLASFVLGILKCKNGGQCFLTHHSS